MSEDDGYEHVSDDEVLVDEETRDTDHDGFVSVVGTDESEPSRSALMYAGTRTLQSTSSLLINRVLDMNPVDMLTTNPITFVAQSMLAAGLQQLQGGPSDLGDSKSIVDAAEKHLEAGQDNLSREQVAVVLGWIDEARKRIAAPPPPTPAPENNKGFPVATIALPKDVTFRSLLSGRSSAPSSTDKRLTALLLALQEFQRFPCKLIHTTRDMVTHRIAQYPAIGAAAFVENLQDRAFILADSTRRPDVKRVLLAVGGPGTAKTSGIQRMASWAGFPQAMLSGEAFRRMYAQSGGTSGIGPFDTFCNWVTDAVRSFRQDGQVVMMGVIILDDFHTTLEQGGPFDAENAPRARQQFLQFLKNAGDSTQEHILSVELAPDCRIPLNMRYVHVAITLNRVPEDMYAKADAAVRSRYSHLGGGYASEEDRRKMTLSIYVPQIKAAIMEQTGLTHLNLDEDATQAAALAVANVDICIFRDKFSNQNGIRGMAELMEKYKQCILKIIPPGATSVRRDIFEAAGFDAASAALQIEDYNKKTDSATSSLESQSALSADIERIRQACSTLSIPASDHLKNLLMRTQDSPSAETVGTADKQLRLYVPCSLRRSCLCTKFVVHRYQNRIQIPAANVVGERLKRDFGYLMADGSSEVDRFMPIKRIVESIYLRMSASRRAGACLPNRIIYARPVSPAAEDLSVYTAMGKVLGGLPVTIVHQPRSVFECALKSNVATFQIEAHHTSLQKIRARSEFMVYATIEDSRERIVTITEVVVGGFSYVVAHRNDSDPYLLTPQGAIQATEKGHSEHVTVSPGNFFRVDLQCSEWKETVVAALSRKLALVPKLVEGILSNVNPKSSADESIVVLIVNPRIATAISTWSTEQGDSSYKSAMSMFMAHLDRQLNDDLARISGLDMRNITLFVLDPSSDQTDDLPAGTLTWMVGTAPIHGRAQHGRNYLQDQIETMKTSLANYANIVESIKPDMLRLSDEEHLIFETLLEFDHEEAKFAKLNDMLDILPISVLESCIRSFADILHSRAMDTFQLGVRFPDLETFRAGWREAYSSYRKQVEDWKAATDLEAEKKRIAEQAKKRDEEAAACYHARQMSAMAAMTSTASTTAIDALFAD